MQRREFLKNVGMSALGYSFMKCNSSMSKSKLNLLFVFADQFRGQAMGYMNQDPVITPNFDRFAKESMVFTNAISSVSICTPARAMLMTGRFPLSTGMVSNCKPGIGYELKEQEVCISDVLKSNGYQTGYIGKWHLECPSKNKTKNPIDGASGWDAWTPPGPRRHGFDFWYAYNTFDEHFSPHYWKNSPDKIEINEWSPKHETDMALNFIEKREKEKPFAVFLSWNPPHTPFIAPQKYIDLYKGKELPLRPNAQETEKRLPYFAAITSLDDQFQRLLDYLDHHKLAENTIVVFTSDHGEMMMSHARMNKDIWFEESIGVPFIIRWREKLKPRKTSMLLPTYDVMPTLLGLLDLPVPESVEGTDYSRTLLGQSDDEPSSAFIGHYALPAKQHFLAKGQPPHRSVKFAKSIQEKGIDRQTWGFRGLRTKRYTYVVDRVPEGIKGYSFNDESSTPYQGSTRIRVTRLLYDNKNDPYQLHPVKAKEANENAIMLELDKKLQQWLDKMNDKFPL